MTAWEELLLDAALLGKLLRKEVARGPKSPPRLMEGVMKLMGKSMLQPKQRGSCLRQALAGISSSYCKPAGSKINSAICTATIELNDKWSGSIFAQLLANKILPSVP